MRWAEFPFTGGEFQNFKSLQTHNMETLLALSGIRERVELTFDQEWSVGSAWSPEQRHDPVGTQTGAVSGSMIAATRRLVGEFVTDIGLLYPMEHGLKRIPSIVLSGLEINRGVIITANPETARAEEPGAVLAGA